MNQNQNRTENLPHFSKITTNLFPILVGFSVLVDAVFRLIAIFLSAFNFSGKKLPEPAFLAILPDGSEQFWFYLIFIGIFLLVNLLMVADLGKMKRWAVIYLTAAVIPLSIYDYYFYARIPVFSFLSIIPLIFIIASIYFWSKLKHLNQKKDIAIDNSKETIKTKRPVFILIFSILTLLWSGLISFVFIGLAALAGDVEGGRIFFYGPLFIFASSIVIFFMKRWGIYYYIVGSLLILWPLSDTIATFFIRSPDKMTFLTNILSSTYFWMAISILINLAIVIYLWRILKQGSPTRRWVIVTVALVMFIPALYSLFLDVK